MDIQQIIALCAQEGIELSVSEQGLDVSFEETPSDGLLDLLRSNKAALTEFIISAQQQGKQVQQIPNVSQEGRFLPVSFSQQRLWIIEELEGASAQYNMPSALAYEGDLDPNIVELSIKVILARHASLRTAFVRQENGEAVSQNAISLDKCGFQLSRLDFRHLQGKVLDSAIEEAIYQQAHQPFDLTGGLLLRVCLAQTDESVGYLMFNMHHIASDGWSVDLLVNEFAHLYSFFAQRQSAPADEVFAQALSPGSGLPVLPIQYADFASWQRQWLQGDLLKEQVRYWQDKLNGLAPTHNLPMDFTRPAQQSFDGAVHYQHIPLEIREKLESYCRTQDTGVFTGLQSVLSLLIGRYANETDVAIGTAIAGRNNREIEHLIGFFVNTLIIRSDLSDNPSFEELFDRNKNTIWDAFEHQNVPFEHLVESLNPPRSLSHNPLFQIMLVLQNNRQTRLTLPNVSLAAVKQQHQVCKFDLEIKVYPTQQGYDIQWIYSRDLFLPATIERMAENFSHLMSVCLASPDADIQSLPLITPQQEQALIDWNQDDISPLVDNHPLCLDEMFVRQVIDLAAGDRLGDTAVTDENGALSYGQLCVQAFVIAQKLRELNIAEQELVAIRSPKGRYQVIATLGVMLAGGAYLPLETSWPNERCEGVLQQAGCRHLLYVIEADRLFSADLQAWLLPDWLTKAQQQHQETLLLNTHAQRLAETWLAEVDVQARAKQLAYVIFTSGSTGKPKGVAIEHFSAVNTILDMNLRYSVTDKDKILAVSALSFDLSVYDIFGLLAAGGQVVFPHDQRALEAEHWLDMVEAHQITLWDTTPASAVLLAEQSALRLNSERASVKQGLAPIRHFLLSGDWVPPGLPAKLWQQFPGCQVNSQGGATEGSIWSICYPVLQDTSHRKSVPYGRSLSGQAFYILNEHGLMCPVGVIGELHIGGVGVAREYYGDEQQTRDRFIWHEGLQQRLYKTGDLGRLLTNSEGQADNIEFIGRIDNQVKVRGYRIELGEIEAALSQHDYVDSAIAMLKQSDNHDQGKQLIAYVTPTQAFLREQAGNQTQHQLDAWQDIFEQTYHSDENVPQQGGSFDISGWDNSYTGEPISAAEMQEWVSTTVERILSLATDIDAKRVLEVGCGTGLLLLRYAGHFKKVHALDLSSSALASVQSQLNVNEWEHVSLHQGQALDINKLEEQAFDLIIVNSVSQYFPDPQYLEQFMQDLANMLSDDGRIFFGDIRNLDLLSAHCCEVQRSKTEPDTSAMEVRNRMARDLQQEKELLISPTWCVRFAQRHPALNSCSILLKRGRGENEMLRYRYDAIFEKRRLQVPARQWVSYEQDAEVRSLLTKGEVTHLGVSQVPNHRVFADIAWKRQLVKAHSLPLYQHSAEQPYAHLESLLTFAEEQGYQAYATWSQDSAEKLDLLFDKGTSMGLVIARGEYQSEEMCNYPQLARICQPITQELKAFVGEQLPNYMAPGGYIYLPHFPLTSNGKVDRNALPAPVESDVFKSEYQPPQTPVQETLCELWMRVLKLEKIGVQDNFFDLGGHSLLATRLIGLIRQSLGKDVPLRVLFSHPTIVTLEQYLKEQEHSALPALTTLHQQEDTVDLSFTQQRLWFLDQMEGPSPEYNIPGAYRIFGPVNVDAMQQALNRVISRHEVLRTCIREEQGKAVCDVQTQWQLQFEQRDVSASYASSPQACMAQIEHELKIEAARAFDLTQDVLLRASFVRLDPNQSLILFNMHHIASDAASIDVLTREFCQLYTACLAGSDDPLAPMPLQFAQYAKWQRDWLTEARMKQDLNDYLANLEGVPNVHSLPLDYSRPAYLGTNGRKHAFVLDGDMSRRLKKLARDQDVTMFMMMQSLFALLLSRFSGEQDIVMGTPVSGRSHPELENLIGFFVNTLVLRCNIDEEAGFVDFLQHNKRHILDAYEHQYLPFDYLVEQLNPERNLSYNPVIQLFFVYQNESHETLSIPGLTLSPYPVANDVAKFDLEMSVIEVNDELRVTINYNTQLFSADSVATMAKSYQQLAMSVLDDATRPVARLDMLNQADRDRLLYQWNRPTEQPDGPVCLHKLFELQVKRTPHHLAVNVLGETLDYQSLNQAANQLAHHLISVGLEPDQLIGISMPRGLDLIVAILAVLKAGAAYVPLDPDMVPERLAFMIRDADIHLLLCPEQAQSDFIGIDQDSSVSIFSPDTERSKALLSQCSQENPVLSTQGHHLAYMVYTSGSTGQPKGVKVEHLGLVNSILEDISTYEIADRNRFLQLVSMNFDAGVSHLFMSLCSGASCHMQTPNIDFVSYVREFEITHTALPVSLLASQPRVSLPSLTHLTIGAEYCPQELSDYWRQGRKLYNVYGPTETTISATIARYNDEKQRDTIGKPIANLQCHVLDELGQLVPPGVIGELHIGGIGVSRGYHNRPELTASRFIPDPFYPESSILPQQRIYKTGDLVKWTSSGCLVFVGRKDTQVKVRGYRIELGEIESCLLQQGGVHACTVQVKQVGQTEPQLVAYLVEDTEHKNEASHYSVWIKTVKDGLAKVLPDYMVPRLYLPIPRIPTTINGKIDLKALPEPDAQQNVVDDYLAPSTETEQTMVDIWQALLGVERIGVSDNFFALGGHSLLAIRLLSRLRSELNVELDIKTLFQSPTIQGICAAVSEQEGQDAGKAKYLPSIGVRPEESPAEMSYAQQRLWFIDQLQGGSHQYNIPGAFALRGELNKEALFRAIDGIIERHQVLRTSFHSAVSPDSISDSNVSLNRQSTWHTPVTEHDLSHLPVAQQQDAVVSLQRQDAEQAFDLSRDILLRVQLLCLSDTHHVLLFNMHHIAADGWSMGIIIKELGRLYRHFNDEGSNEQRPILEPLAIQYQDFAYWQRHQLPTDRLMQQTDYWRQQLRGMPQLHQLPCDFARPARMDFKGAMVTRQLSANMSARLHTLSQEQDLTLFMLLHTAFSVLLHRLSHSDDIVIGTPTAGRLHQDTEALIGFFVNTLVLRSNINSEASLLEQARDNKKVIIDAFQHQDLPFESLVEALNPQRSLSHNPLFQVMLVLQHQQEDALALENLSLEPVQQQTVTTQFDLNLHVLQSDTGLTLNWQYATNLFSEARVSQMAEQFETLLLDMLNQPETPVQSVQLLTKQEHQRVAMFSQGDADNKIKQNSPDRQFNTPLASFQASVMASGDKTALIQHEMGLDQAIDDASSRLSQSLTYHQLDRRAQALACQLTTKGIAAGDRVAMLLERGAEQVVAILAILKCGACYVPLDGNLPLSVLSNRLVLAQVKLLVRDQSGEALASSTDCQQLDVTDLPVIDAETDMTDVSETEGFNPALPAYILFTSGTTGRPKAIEMSGGALSNLIKGIQQASDNLHKPCHVLQFSSVGFDVSFLEIWMAFVSGGAIHMISEEMRLQPQVLNRLIDSQGINGLCIPYTLLSALVEAERQEPKDFTSLAFIASTAEALKITPDIAAFFSDHPHIQLQNYYGPAETHVVTCQSLDGHPLNWPEHPPIGKPLANSQCYVLDTLLQPVPVGVFGELYIGGENLADGYFDQPELTANRFVSHPDRKKERLYRTGDWVRWNERGELEYQGRIDQQVKIRGVRIEPAEIESLITHIPGVSEAKVIVDDKEGALRLLAFVRPVELEMKVDAIAQYCQNHLPDYMVPNQIMLVDEFVKNVNGKVDTHALMAMAAGQVSSKTRPNKDLERELAGIWQALLDVDDICLEDSFFALGGHSLLVTKLVAAIYKRWSVTLPISTVFQHQTLTSLCQQLERELALQKGLAKSDDVADEQAWEF